MLTGCLLEASQPRTILLAMPTTRYPCWHHRRHCCTRQVPCCPCWQLRTCWPLWSVAQVLPLWSLGSQGPLAPFPGGCWGVLTSSESRTLTLSTDVGAGMTAAVKQKCCIHCCQQNVDIHKNGRSNCWILQTVEFPQVLQKIMLCFTNMLDRICTQTPSCSALSCWSSTYRKFMLKYCTNIFLIYSMLK